MALASAISCGRFLTTLLLLRASTAAASHSSLFEGVPVTRSLAPFQSGNRSLFRRASELTETFGVIDSSSSGFVGSVLSDDVLYMIGASVVGRLDTTTDALDFIDISDKVPGGFMPFDGGVLAGDILYMVPWGGSAIGRLNVATQAFDTIDLSGKVSGEVLFDDSVLVGDILYMVPSYPDAVGRLDTTAGTFASIDISDKLTGEAKFESATLVGNILYMIPSWADAVGRLDTTTDTFDVINISHKLHGNYKFHGAVLVGNFLYMIPKAAGAVGRLDTTTDTFDIIDISSTLMLWGSNDSLASLGVDCFIDSVLVGDIIYMVPYYCNCVGRLDTTSDTFNMIDIDDKVGTWGQDRAWRYKFSAGVLAGNIVYMVPYSLDVLGRLDTTTDAFDVIDVSGKVSGRYKYDSAVAVGAVFYFVPNYAENIGKLCPTTDECLQLNAKEDTSSAKEDTSSATDESKTDGSTIVSLAAVIAIGTAVVAMSL